MSESTLLTIAMEMLQSTNVYAKSIEEISYGKREYDEDTYKITLIDIVQAKTNAYRGGFRANTQNNKQQAYSVIVNAMIEFLDGMPANYSFKMHTHKKFSQWCNKIKEQYQVSTVDEEEWFYKKANEQDKGILIVKALQSREGVTKSDIAGICGVDERTIQKDLRRISPNLYGNPDNNEMPYKPFTIGGQPIQVNICEKQEKGDRGKTLYYTPNSLHPIVLQGNLMQIISLLKALSMGYEDENGICAELAKDIWFQLSDYAKDRVKNAISWEEPEFEDFIAIIEDECPTDQTVFYQTDRDMMRNECLELSKKDKIMFLQKHYGSIADIEIESTGGTERLEKQKLLDARVIDDIYTFSGANGKTTVSYDQILSINIIIR